MKSRVAVVDDDDLLRDTLVDYLSSQGFEVIGLESGDALRGAISKASPECVILDLVMPEEDGLSVLRWLRGVSQVPVIMLTSADGPADRVVGLEMGADDYVSKPADLRELLARIRSVLRRSKSSAGTAQPVTNVQQSKPSQAGEHWFGRWRLDRSRRRMVDSAGEVLPVTGAEFGLLCVFADHPNVVLSRDRLLELSGTDPAEVFDRAVDLRITRLRRKIEPTPGDPTVIRTVRGHGGGYEFVPTERPNYGR